MNQNEISSTALRDYIKISLQYWDPWNLIHGAGAPINEYDSYIDRVINFTQNSGTDDDKLRSQLHGMFTVDGMPTSNVDRAVDGMVEGIMFFALINN